MKQDTTTTRDKAIEWWGNLKYLAVPADAPCKKMYIRKYLIKTPFYDLTGIEIETIYLSEHPSIKADVPSEKEEVDLLEVDAYKNMPNWNKYLHKNWREWAEKCFDAGKSETKKENEILRQELEVWADDFIKLKKENERIKEALQWIEMKSWHKNEWVEMEEINAKAKAALKQ